VPLLSRGALIGHVDATRDALPQRGPLHAISVDKVAGGTQVACAGLKAVTGQFGGPRRHGCIVVRATATEPNCGIGVGARINSAPECGYSLMVSPHYRVVNLARYVATTKHAHSDHLHEFEFHPSVARVGQPNEVELRCADSILQVFVNGQQIAACLDAAFGFGGFAWRLQSRTKLPTRAVIHSVSLYAVA
jgi:hypothetical protein